MKINVVKMYEDVKLPTYATDGSGCFDIYARTCAPHLMLDAAEAVFDTGLKFEVPVGHVMLIFSRSGHGFKNSVRLSNCVGVIDSDYRGEVKVKLKCDSRFASFTVNNGDRIAQAMIVPIPKVEFVVVDELSSTARGDGGFGSTGSGA